MTDTKDVRQAPGPPLRLGDFVSAQLRRLCGVVGLDDVVDPQLPIQLLGSAARRRLSDPPSDSFISDDHTPVEYSLTFPRGRTTPDLRMLVEPGGGTGDLAADGRVGRQVVEELAARWGFSMAPLTRLADIFFPSAPHGPFALWCALVFRRSGRPGLKVYLNPGAGGPAGAADAVAEALARLGYRAAAPLLLQQVASRYRHLDGFPFFALDLGNWNTPRVKVYIGHRDFSASDATAVSRLCSGEHPERVSEFFRLVAGNGHCRARPVVSYFSFTGAATDRPSGYTLHVPVRDYVRDDREARGRAAEALRWHGVHPAILDRALAAVTPRPLDSGVGLIAYLALAHERHQSPRVSVYLSAEAYHVRAPRMARLQPAVKLVGPAS
jgi:DMATS type aromatic prenyltransferase